jgi:hypothetical protein
MRRVLSLIATGIVLSSLAPVLEAQKTTTLGPGSGGSPHVRTHWTVDGANVSIEYGRPYLKGREEAKMMPPGSPWRTGADQATVITTDKPLKFGAMSLAPGSYTINTQPGDWQLILGKLEKPGAWGIPYNQKLEIGRTPMKAGKTTAPVEQVTISIDDTPAGANLRIEWGTTSVIAPFTVG